MTGVTNVTNVTGVTDVPQFFKSSVLHILHTYFQYHTPVLYVVWGLEKGVHVFWQVLNSGPNLKLRPKLTSPLSAIEVLF